MSEITDTEIRQAMKRLSNQQRVFEGVGEIFEVYLKTREAVNGVNNEIAGLEKRLQAKSQEFAEMTDHHNRVRETFKDEIERLAGEKAELENKLRELSQKIANSEKDFQPVLDKRNAILAELDGEIKRKQAERQSILDSIEQLKKKFAA